MTTVHTTAIGAMQQMIASTGKSRIALSREMGRSDTYLTTKLQEKSKPRTDTLSQLANLCGYTLQLVRGDDVIVIDPPND